ncbi:MAG: beta-ketoacyl-ACP synthase II [Betaproteobacteria bacterium AqS2]|uniref:3-oxoacyl-[acyl-carrier-protein] synthase 2 n=1 Tax=Candidatus Amphirhobacter heronislandensis TaxID=1732024 RepID=A0A930UGF1_9GAMM|nr:beta-ketoacyl-ACP synthase II [Betaproteobacteria bacterium AqS2]
MKGRRVAVTGLGIVSPVGNGVAAAWDSLLAGRSGVTAISRFDPSRSKCRIAAEVKDFKDADVFNPRHARRADVFIRYGIAAAAEALGDAGLADGAGFDPARAGALIGSGIGGLPLIEQAHSILAADGPRQVSPFFVPSSIINMAAGWVSMLYGLRGPNLAIATACTTGTHCIGEGARKIAYGDADVIVAGGAESSITELAVAGFGNAQALADRNDEPERASRPFDVARNGFVLGEGAGVVVLEEAEHAKARGAEIYCELAGYGQSGDAHHITAPPEDGAGARLAMANALRDAEIEPADVRHVNAHGTSTPLGDIAETRAIREVFGPAADDLAVSGTKSMTGHLLGAAGGIEAVFTVLALARGKAPPTINLEQPDPQCDLDYVAAGSRDLKADAALSNSFGFGGTNASLLFTRR